MAQNTYNLRKRQNTTVVTGQELEPEEDENEDDDSNDVMFNVDYDNQGETTDSSFECLENLVRDIQERRRDNYRTDTTHEVPPTPTSPSTTRSRVFPTRIVRNSNRRRNTSPVDEASAVMLDTMNVEREDSGHRRRRIPWTKADYEEIIWCLYECEIQNIKSEKNIFELWRKRNPNVRPHMTSATLSNQRRFIINKKKLNEIELNTIKCRVQRELGNLTEDVDDPIMNVTNNNPVLTNTFDNLVTIATPSEMSAENSHDVNEQQQNGVDQSVNRELNEIELIDQTDEGQLHLEKEIQEELDITRNQSLDDRVRLPKIFDSHKVNKIISDCNIIIDKYKRQRGSLDLTELNHLIFATAKVITRKFKKLQNKKSKKADKEEIPIWQKRIERKISEWRKEVSVLHESKSNNASKKTKNKAYGIKRKYHNFDHVQLDEILKQKISSYTQRIKRYKKRNDAYRQNKMFTEDKKRFYRMLTSTNINVQNVPSPEMFKEYWSDLWSVPSTINEDAMWMKREEERIENTNEMSHFTITHDDLMRALSNTQNWKAPGWDQIQNFWLKKLNACHDIILNEFNKILVEPDTTPLWLTIGNTYFIPKNEKNEDVKNYRPITCLPVLYKLLTSIIKTKIYKHLLDNNILPMEQRGCLEGANGCKDLMLLDKIISGDCRKKQKNLSMAWIDLLKAYDNVSHEWMVKVLRMYKIDKKSVDFCEKIMKRWKTRLIINTQSSQIITDDIQIRRGIYQGDSLSPLLFCMALIPLSAELERMNKGYSIQRSSEKICHLLYMDDLKLFTTNDDDLNKMLEVVHNVCSDIDMKIGFEKCARVRIIKGKVVSSLNPHNVQNTIQYLTEDQSYKYLGFFENSQIEQDQMKEKIKQEYFRRTRLVLRTELNGKNKVEAINSLAVPVIDYTFGIIEWTQEELNKIDSKTRKCLTMHKMLHPRSDVVRLYLPRKNGGRGLRNIHDANDMAFLRMGKYITNGNENDKILKIIYTCLSDSNTQRNIVNRAKRLERSFNIDDNGRNIKKYKNEVKQIITKKHEEDWRKKPLHGQFKRQIENNASLDQSRTFDWMKMGNLKGVTEAYVTSAQDQALRTKYYDRHILKLNTDDRCRLCKTQPETITHVISGCGELAKREYVNRHNRVCTYVHHQICQHFNLPVAEKWYIHNPDPVMSNDEVVVLYDQSIQTDRTVLSNRPDIVIKNKKKNECLLIDVSIPADSNVNAKENEKKLKYKDLAIEVQQMWNMKSCKIVPIIVGAIPKSLKSNLDSIPGYFNVHEIQKCTLLGTTYILRKFGI